MTTKFLRRDWKRHSKLGRRRKKKQVWRKPKGRDNKMREKRRGYPIIVSVGYKKRKTEDKKPITIKNIKDLDKINKNKKIIIGKTGKKKKIEIIKKIKEMKLKINNFNIDKFLNQSKKKLGEKKNESK